MYIKIKSIEINEMDKYAKIPISFEVKSILEPALINNGIGGIKLTERKLETPYIKNYDNYGSGPLGWNKRFDTKNWGFFTAAAKNGELTGGAVIAYNTKDVHMLEGKKDISVLWDLRIHSDYRRRGIGKALFRTAVEWSGERNCKQMKIETQNTNINACKFYESQGCILGGINNHIYTEEDCKNEIRLLWYYEL